MRLLAAVTIFLSTSMALAMYGTVQSGGGPESACRLVISTADDGIVTICSGTLTSPIEVATAAHCVDGVEGTNHLKVRVDCGFTGYNSEEFLGERNIFGRPIWNKELQFKESIRVERILTNVKGPAHSVIYDTAKLQLEKASKLSPTPIAVGVGAHELSSCSTTGFGAGPEDRYVGRPFTGTYDHIEFTGRLWRSTARVDQVSQEESMSLLSIAQMEDPTEALMHFMVDRGYLAFSTNGGDSGAGLICDVQGERRLVGVVRGSTLEVNATAAGYFQLWPIYNPSDITKLLYQAQPVPVSHR